MEAKKSQVGIKIQEVPGRVGNKLHSLDANGDGVLDAEELTKAIEELFRSETKIKYWKRFFAVGALFIIVQCGIMAGIIYGIVVASQEVTVENNYLLATGGGSQPLVTAPYRWSSDSDLFNLLNLTETQLGGVSALSFTLTGGVNVVTKVTSVMAVESPVRTILFTTADAVITLNSTTLNVIWKNDSVKDLLAQWESNAAPEAPGAPASRRFLPSCCTTCLWQCGGGGNSVSYACTDPSYC